MHNSFCLPKEAQYLGKWGYGNDSHQHLVLYLDGFHRKLEVEYANLCLQYSQNDF